MADAVHFWFDITDPWSYLASGVLVRIAAEADRPLLWQPVQLGPAEPYSNEARQRHAARDLQRWARWLGEPLVDAAVDPARCTEAMRRLLTVPPAKRGTVACRLLREVWGEGRDPLVAVRDLQPSVETLATPSEAARRAGVFATPSVTVGDEVIWGLDRLHFLRRALGLPSAPEPFARPAEEGHRLELFHDFASPYSYLGFCQMDRFEEQTGVRPTLTPILLGALFRDVGTPMVPLMAFDADRQRWAAQDMQQWAAWWGQPFQFTSTFPLRTVSALRVAIQEPKATEPLYRAAWEADLDVGDPAVLHRVLKQANLPAAELIEGTADPKVKEQLRINTSRAVQAGVCGVPSFLVDDAHMVWGQDRLHIVAGLFDGLRGGGP
ncbi:MAG: DsbA family protein [Myxococcales bacterium]|nr:DsbA family protein [Myxococcales bacterium]